MNLETYVDFFSTLHRKTIQGVKAPHKPILLLSIIHQYEVQAIYDNSIVIDKSLVHIFKQLWEMMVTGVSDIYSCDIYSSMWRMYKELFWRIIPNDGYDSAITVMTKTISKISRKEYELAVSHCEIDSDLSFFFTLDFARDRLKEVLVSTYFHKSLEEYKQIESRIVDFIGDTSEESNDNSEDCPEDPFERLPEDLRLDMEIIFLSELRNNISDRVRFRKFFPNISAVYLNLTQNGNCQLENLDSNVQDEYKSLIKKIAEFVSTTKYDYEIRKPFDYAYFSLFPCTTDSVIAVAAPSSELPIRRRWSKEEELEVKFYFEKGRTFEEIAQRMHRTVESVKYRLHMLGLVNGLFERIKPICSEVKSDEEVLVSILSGKSDFMPSGQKKADCSFDNVFIPKGKLKDISDYAKSSTDLLFVVAIIDFIRDYDASCMISYDQIACMIIANVWELAYHLDSVRNKESRIVECIDFLIKVSEEEGTRKLGLSDNRDEVYDVIKDLPMYDIYEDVADELVQSAPFRVLRAWFPDLKRFEIQEQSQSFENRCLYSIHPRKYDPHIMINESWRKYFIRNNKDLHLFFVEKYLDFIGSPAEDKEKMSLLSDFEMDTPENSVEVSSDDNISLFANNIETEPFTPVYNDYQDDQQSQNDSRIKELDIQYDDGMVVLTKDIIRAAKTPRGGITKSQLAALGMNWPPKPDWQELALGMRLSNEEFVQFMTIKYIK